MTTEITKIIQDSVNLINQKHERITRSITRTVEDAIEIGEHLMSIKADLPHGQFESFCSDAFEFSVPTRKLYTQFFQNKEAISKKANVSLLTFREIRKLISESKKPSIEIKAEDNSTPSGGDRKPSEPIMPARPGNGPGAENTEGDRGSVTPVRRAVPLAYFDIEADVESHQDGLLVHSNALLSVLEEGQPTRIRAEITILAEKELDFG